MVSFRTANDLVPLEQCVFNTRVNQQDYAREWDMSGIGPLYRITYDLENVSTPNVFKEAKANIDDRKSIRIWLCHIFSRYCRPKHERMVY